jgi:hypothetical protein
MRVLIHRGRKMKTLSLRQIPKEVASIVEETAQKRHLSLNRAVISLLEEMTGHGRVRERKREYHDLDHLAGRWSQKELRTFDENLSKQRVIEKELWR